jgi:hypothetical protein
MEAAESNDTERYSDSPEEEEEDDRWSIDSDDTTGSDKSAAAIERTTNIQMQKSHFLCTYPLCVGYSEYNKPITFT